MEKNIIELNYNKYNMNIDKYSLLTISFIKSILEEMLQELNDYGYTKSVLMIVQELINFI